MMLAWRKSKLEPTIALINIVLLMLIFFLIAGTLAPPLAEDLQLVETRDLDAAQPPRGLVIHADGRMQSDGAVVTQLDRFLAAYGDGPVHVIPDRALPAKTLLQISADLRDAGAETILIATETVLE